LVQFGGLVLQEILKYQKLTDDGHQVMAKA
jgi:hypothetical protein